jgi:hypothetical protein
MSIHVRQDTRHVVSETGAIALRPVVVDLYRDIHKGIRAELFALTEEAGRIDPSQWLDRAALRDHVASVVDLLRTHAEHEDTHVQPAMEFHLPDLADRVVSEHEMLEVRLGDLLGRAGDATETSRDPRWPVHCLHLELASFTSAYLAHQDLEERVIMPALEAAIGVEATLDLHQAIVGSIPPAQMAASLAVMLPAMNVDDRSELLGGMRAGAPAEIFGPVWGLAVSVLEPADVDALVARLHL